MKLSKTSQILLVGLALILFCSSCIPILSTETELRLSDNEKYSLKMIFVLEGQDPMMTSQFETALGDAISQAQGLGIEAEWQKLSNQSDSSNTTYQLKLSGTGYDGLNELVFDRQQAVSKDSPDDQVDFNFDPSASFLMSGQQNSFTLIAGKIISANGNITNNKTVVWNNPKSNMEAIVSTTGLSSITTFLIFGILVIGVAMGIILAIGANKSARRSSQEALVDRSGQSVLFCMNCGKQVPPQAQYCPHCGERTS